MRAFTSKITTITIVMGVVAVVIIVVLVAVTLLAGRLSWSGGDGNPRAPLSFWLACVLTALTITEAGYILRSTASSIVTGIAVLFVSGMLRLVLIKSLRETLPESLPSGATSEMTVSDTVNPTQTIDYSSPGTATFVWLVYASVFVIPGAIRYQKSDV